MSLYKDEQWLDEQHNGKGLAYTEMAELAECSPTTITRWMDELGVPRDTVGGIHDDPEWLREKYHREGMTMKEMADEADVESDVSILRSMEKHDIPRRSKSTAAVMQNPGAGFVHADKRGYETIKHSVNNVTKNYPIHRLLAIAMYGYDEVVDNHVHHKNGLKWDNRPENIEILSPREHHLLHDEERSRNNQGQYA